ncbi:hypothetical protein DB30_05227 [Enhygromyxa salina]|uniref:Uncharacterized protein n=1 Tax=Enhygromyxa salina TaxID=215803 RepID=A0A0C1ZDT8_9BACT|nr:DUF5713 family protein [Enhygromyxa salina]KIG15809.1 hypothetical protein DB30_05227 [Enhygromyxa salina]
MTITNAKLSTYKFVADMYADGYFPDAEVAKVEAVLRELCEKIEQTKVQRLDELYPLTHAATERINELQADFEAAGSDLETGAREAMGADFAFIAEAYGFDADIEELIAPRDW